MKLLCMSGSVIAGIDDRLRARVSGVPSQYVTNPLGQLSLASRLGRLIEYQLRLG